MTAEQAQIIERIQKLPPRDAAQIAARAAMRVLPVLAELWPVDSSVDKLKRRVGLANKADSEKNAKIVLAVFRACQCAQAVSAAVLYSIIAWDLDYLSRASRLAEQPLWPEAMPDKLQVDWQSLRSNLLELDAGFEYWVDWYEARLKGEAQD